MLLNLPEHLKPNKFLKRKYRGIVVDNQDPKGVGRVKALVTGIYQVGSGNYDRLPWIHPAPNGAGSPSSSSFKVPTLGSEILVNFPTDDLYSPEYTNSWSSNHNHAHELWSEDYPNSSGYVDDTGQWLKVNKLQGYIEFFRMSLQQYLQLDNEGNLVVNIPKDFLLRVGGDFKLVVDGNTISTTSQYDHVISGNSNVKIAGSDNRVAGSDINFNSSGDINMDGANINAQLGSSSGGVAKASIAESNVATLRSEIDSLQQRLDSLKSLAESLTDRGTNLNKSEVDQGIPGIYG